MVLEESSCEGFGPHEGTRSHFGQPFTTASAKERKTKGFLEARQKEATLIGSKVGHKILGTSHFCFFICSAGALI